MAIPYGELVTYGDVAASAGSLRAGRAAGGALSRCPIELFVPCHRVVHAGGTIGGYGRHEDRKRWLLRHEGRSDRTFRRSREKMVRCSSAASFLVISGPCSSRAPAGLRRCVGGVATGPAGSSLSLEVASSDLAVGAPQHFELGIFSSDGQSVKLLSFGQMAFSFSFLGDGSQSPEPGPQAVGTYVGRSVRRRAVPRRRSPIRTWPAASIGGRHVRQGGDVAGGGDRRLPGKGRRRSPHLRRVPETLLPAPGRPRAAHGEPDGRFEGRAHGRDRFAGARRRAGARPELCIVRRSPTRSLSTGRSW